MKKVMRFGKYLIDRGIITEKNLIDALEMQKKEGPSDEIISVDMKVLTNAEVHEIQTAQQDTGSSFLSIAHELGYVNDLQKQRILHEHHHRKPQIGDVLDKMRVVNKRVVEEELVRFRKKVWEYQSIKEDLKKMWIFHELEENILYHLSYLPKRITYKEGESIFKEGSRSDSFFCVLSGAVLITKDEGKDNKKVVLATIKKLDTFGESAMLKKDARTASAIAGSDIVVYEFKKNDLHRFLRSHSKAAYTILLFIANSLLTKLHLTNAAFSKEKFLHSKAETDEGMIY